MVSPSDTEWGHHGLSGWHTAREEQRNRVSGAQEREVLAVKDLWLEVLHQTCQFPAPRDSSKPAIEADRSVKTAMRKHLPSTI